jgi:hypothetical protein
MSSLLCRIGLILVMELIEFTALPRDTAFNIIIEDNEK